MYDLHNRTTTRTLSAPLRAAWRQEFLAQTIASTATRSATNKLNVRVCIRITYICLKYTFRVASVCVYLSVSDRAKKMQQDRQIETSDRSLNNMFNFHATCAGGISRLLVWRCHVIQSCVDDDKVHNANRPRSVIGTVCVSVCLCMFSGMLCLVTKTNDLFRCRLKSEQSEMGDNLCVLHNYAEKGTTS